MTAFYERVAGHAALPYEPLEHDPVDAAAAAVVPEAVARAFAVAPIRLEPDGTVVLAASTPAADEARDAVFAFTGREARLVISPPHAIERVQERLYGPATAAPIAPAPRPPAHGGRRRYRDLARHGGLEFVELCPEDVDVDAARLLREEVCHALRLLPLVGGAVATSAPHDPLVRAVAAAVAPAEPRLVVAAPADLDAAVAAVFGSTVAQPEAIERRTIGRLLLEAGLVSEEQLEDALRLQERVGGRLGHLLLHERAVDETQVAEQVASQLRLPLADLADVRPDPQALELVPEPVARRHRLVPLAIDGHVLHVAVADPLDEHALAELHRHTQLPVKLVLATRSGIEALLQRTYATRYVRIATTELLNRSPEESAYRVLSGRQKAFFSFLVVASVVFLLYDPIATVIAFNIASILFYAGFSAYKFKLIEDALGHDLELPVSDAEIATLDERALPVYTILVPLYREANVASRIVRALDRLDYPRSKLDVKLIVEADDAETQAALAATGLPPHLKVVVVPDAQPKTKPKACNYGLIQAEGRYVVIYDAEDRPEPDQLKKAVVAFSKAEPRVVCIQCKLNYYNRDQNVLTRWFTSEYSSWFDLFMPGLDAAGSPIPLGGTSNHLVREKLIELGAWDPFNVTEDADLGIRLHRAGYKTAIIDSTTFEEANSELYNWIRQRSRWVKGYIQTWLVHMRHPVRLLHQIGWRSFVSFQFVIAGTFVGFLLNPFYWVLTSLWLATQAGVIRELFPSFVFYAAAFGLFVGNFVFTYVNVVGTMRRGYHDLVKYALLSPLYWALMSVGAWKGFLQLFYRPFYWEKTVHGLDEAVEAAEATP